MPLSIAKPSPRPRPRLAGLLYLSLGLFAPFSLIYVPSRLIVPGDAATTARNIMASESLFRLGIVSALITAIINVLVVLALYDLLKPVSRYMAVLMMIFILISMPIAMLNEVNNLAVLYLLSGSNSLAAFTSAQANALVALLLDIHADGLIIADILYGLWLFPMGYLVYRSGFLPRIIGVLLWIGGVGYLIQSIATVMFPTFNVSVILYTDWGELIFPLWLVIRGVNVERWQKRAGVSAEYAQDAPHADSSETILSR